MTIFTCILLSYNSPPPTYLYTLSLHVPLPISFIASPIEDVFHTENYEWDIIHSPGHADDHIALYNREKGWMFGGDLYVYSRPRSMYAFESLPILIDSLQNILTYDFKIGRAHV